MELKDFIARALTDIAEGVRKAQEQTAHLDARINPFRGFGTKRSRTVIKVDFTVGIEEATGTATEGKLGVLYGVIGASTKGASKSDTSAATTIKFSVPMLLPTEQDTSKHKKG